MVCNQSPGMSDWLLELGAARVARPVLRGGGGSDATSLPNHIGTKQGTESCQEGALACLGRTMQDKDALFPSRAREGVANGSLQKVYRCPGSVIGRLSILE